MLALQGIELLVLVQVFLVDVPTGPGGRASAGLVVYLVACALTVLLQGIGILLVVRGRLRAGGLFQIVASAPHVLKLEGLIGVVGGMKAWGYASQR